MKRFKTIADLVGYYGTKKAGSGNLYEVLSKAIMQEQTTSNHHKYCGLSALGRVDKYSAALGACFEFKTGCGWLSNDNLTKEQASQLKEDIYDGKKLYGKDFVVYNPKFTIEDGREEILINSFVFTASDFTQMLIDNNLIRIKKSSKYENGYGIAIQTWQTTPTWGTAKSKAREQMILDTMWDRPTYAEFLGIDI